MNKFVTFITTFRSYEFIPLYVTHINLFVLLVATLFIGLIVITIKRTAKRDFRDFLAIENTTQMRGMAILLVIVDHIAYHLLGKMTAIENAFLFWGTYGVVIFLLLSGFGLTISYKTKGFVKGWLANRYIRIWLPYLIITIIWFLFDHFLTHIHHPISEMILTLIPFPIDDNWHVVDFNMWFIPFLLVQYVIFYFVFRIKTISSIAKIVICFAIISLVTYIHNTLLLNLITSPTTQWPMNYATYFPSGIVIAIYYKEILSFLHRYKRSAMAIGLILMIIVALTQSRLLQDSTFWGAMFFILIMALMHIYSLSSRFLGFIGAISYEIYLVHGPLLYRYDFILFKGPVYVTFPIYFAVVICAAYILHTTTNLLLQYITPQKFTFLQMFFHRSSNSLEKAQI